MPNIHAMPDEISQFDIFKHFNENFYETKDTRYILVLHLIFENRIWCSDQIDMHNEDYRFYARPKIMKDLLRVSGLNLDYRGMNGVLKQLERFDYIKHVSVQGKKDYIHITQKSRNYFNNLTMLELGTIKNDIEGSDNETPKQKRHKPYTPQQIKMWINHNRKLNGTPLPPSIMMDVVNPEQFELSGNELFQYEIDSRNTEYMMNHDHEFIYKNKTFLFETRFGKLHLVENKSLNRVQTRVSIPEIQASKPQQITSSLPENLTISDDLLAEIKAEIRAEIRAEMRVFEGHLTRIIENFEKPEKQESVNIKNTYVVDNKDEKVGVCRGVAVPMQSKCNYRGFSQFKNTYVVDLAKEKVGVCRGDVVKSQVLQPIDFKEKKIPEIQIPKKTQPIDLIDKKVGGSSIQYNTIQNKDISSFNFLLRNAQAKTTPKICNQEDVRIEPLLTDHDHLYPEENLNPITIEKPIHKNLPLPSSSVVSLAEKIKERAEKNGILKNSTTLPSSKAVSGVAAINQYDYLKLSDFNEEQHKKSIRELGETKSAKEIFDYWAKMCDKSHSQFDTSVLQRIMTYSTYSLQDHKMGVLGLSLSEWHKSQGQDKLNVLYKSSDNLSGFIEAGYKAYERRVASTKQLTPNSIAKKPRTEADKQIAKSSLSNMRAMLGMR